MNRDIRERIGKDAFMKMHNDLLRAGFEYIQSEYPEVIYDPQAASIMRDRTHTEHIERWAEFVKTHPRSVWIKEVKPLIIHTSLIELSMNPIFP